MDEVCSAYYQSPLGLLHIAGTDHYINEISFVDTIEKPAHDTNRRRHSTVLIQCIEQLIQYFHGERRVFEFAVYQEGSAFQKKVWDELIGIPFGKTISYLELSRRLGDTKAIRAAASANGKNHIAIVVPCHRVIGSRNDLVGYAGGIWRKKWLLEHEARITYGIQTLF
jgi:methylated-DNA-[protein]-cysteine S-methyltransferase